MDGLRPVTVHAFPSPFVPMTTQVMVQEDHAPQGGAAGRHRDQDARAEREPLTRLEQRILGFMIDFLRQNTYQPSIREIGRRFRMKSTKTVSDHLEEIARKGYLEKRQGRSRGIRIVDLAVLERRGALVPVYASVAALRGSTPDDVILLDDRVAPPGAYLFVAPRGAPASSGILKGDWILVDPRAPDGSSQQLLLWETQGEVEVARASGAGDCRLLGAVVSVLRRSVAPQPDPAELALSEPGGR